MTAILLALLALCVALLAAYLALVAVQLGGANDPHATPTPEPTTLPVETPEPQRVWLPWSGGL